MAYHDGALPLITPQVIVEVVTAAKLSSAAIPAVKVRDTIKAVSCDYVQATPDRDSLYSAQTPQVFDLQLYRQAINRQLSVTDDSMLVEQLGVKVKIVEGDYRNIKITTPLDLIIAGALLNELN